MNVLLIFLWIILAFIAMAIWEAYIEGKDPWARKSCGWKIKIRKNFVLSGYHFFLWVMLGLLIFLPLVIYGWDIKLFGILLSATMIGGIIEDFLWFCFNPYYTKKQFNPKEANWYPWINVGLFKIPLTYILSILIAFLSWWFLWRV